MCGYGFSEIDQMEPIAESTEGRLARKDMGSATAMSSSTAAASTSLARARMARSKAVSLAMLGSDGMVSIELFFFFLNLYKATLLCLSVVYMIVYAVYGCVRLCDKKEDARPKAEPTGNEDKHRATCRLTTRPGSLQGDKPGQAA
jgi:hypothetical protein